MEVLVRGFMAAWLLVSLLGCTCTIAGCSEAEARTDGRVSTEHVGSFDNGHVNVFVLTDSKTGRKWLFVQDTSYCKTAIDVEPMEGD